MEENIFITKRTCGNCRYMDFNDNGEECCMLLGTESLPEKVCENYVCIFNDKDDVD